MFDSSSTYLYDMLSKIPSSAPRSFRAGLARDLFPTLVLYALLTCAVVPPVRDRIRVLETFQRGG